MKISILGAGVFGLALATQANSNNHNIIMYTPFEEEKKSLEETKTHPSLKDYKIPDQIKFTTNLKEATTNQDLIILALPTPFIDSTLKKAKEYFEENTNICIASKGIDPETQKFVSEIVTSTIKTTNLAVISGPTFAIDLATQTTCGLTLAATNSTVSSIIKNTLENKNLKLRTSTDIIGVEICGTIKNIFAIASGILSGLNCSDSTKAMLLTEALNDMQQIILSLGGEKDTILTYAGFGDLILTCSSTTSRNFSFGKLIGENSTKEQLEDYLNKNTTEGYNALQTIYNLLKTKNIEIKFINLIYDIVTNNENPKQLLTFLVEKD